MEAVVPGLNFGDDYYIESKGKRKRKPTLRVGVNQRFVKLNSGLFFTTLL